MNKTYSLPVQKLDASLANQVTTPRSSSGRPMRPIGFNLDHLSNSSGCLSRYAAVILISQFQSQSLLSTLNEGNRTHAVYICPGDKELTRILSGPNSQAILRAIWRTPDLLALYGTQAWSYREPFSSQNHSSSNKYFSSLSKLTLFVILPDIEAIRMILPPFPNFLIC